MALRKPDARPDVPIVLGDGQAWSFPRPVVEFGLSFGDDGDPTFRRTSLGFGDDYMAILDRFYEGDVGEQYNALAAMSVRLLRINYTLDDAALVALLPYRPADETNRAMWEEILSVATGNTRPKGDPGDDT